MTGACAAILLALLAPRAIPDRAPADAPGVRLRVLAANVAGNDAAAEQVLERGAPLGRRRLQRHRARAARSRSPTTPRASKRLFPHRVLQPLPGFRGTGLYSRLPAADGQRAPRPPSSAWRRPSCACPAPRRSSSSPSTCPPRRTASAAGQLAAMTCATLPPARGRGAAAGAGGRLQRDARPRRAAAPARPRLPRRRRAGRDRAAPHVAGGQGRFRRW